MEKHLECLQNAIRSIRVADHILYVTYPVIKDKRLLLKALEEVCESVILIIKAILYHDSAKEMIKTSQNSHENFEIFISKCAKRYNLTEEDIIEIKEILYTSESHKKSSMEFIRKEKVVIMADSLKTMIIEPVNLKKHMNFAKSFINKAKFGMNI
ncbi:MAG: hypothetical protein Q8L27_03035 [archaeon]|nr:hypothetical protein [archaeon]